MFLLLLISTGKNQRMGGKIENFALRNILLQVTWGYTVIIITCNDLMMDQGGILQGIMGQEMLNILGTEE